MLKKILFPLITMVMLAGCATPPTTIEVSPTMTLPQQDPSLMGVTVSINGADQRPDQALAKVTRDNQIVTLTASRDEHVGNAGYLPAGNGDGGAGSDHSRQRAEKSRGKTSADGTGTVCLADCWWCCD